MKIAAILIFSITFVALVSCILGAQQGCQSCCKNGRNGKDGRNGQDGINGVDGVDGVDGKDGVNGADGKDGTNGNDGKDGQNGKDGKDGTNGTNSEGRNWKECAWDKINDDKDIGIVKACSFTKKRTSTYLYAQASSGMHIYTCNACCKRWFFTFDNVECTPVPIDGVVYMQRGGNDVHRPRVVLGRCKVEKKGQISVALNVGNCHGYGDANAYTGWNSATRIYIEEIEGPQ